MSSTTITSPINIKTTTMNCQNTCFYSFNYNYGNSSCTITNAGDHLKFSYDAPSSIVIYNDANYTVEDIRLYKPSLNEYYNTHVDAELIINHSGEGGMNVVVCIPIVTSDDKSQSNTLFNQLIPNAPTTQNPVASVNVTNYSLNYLLPRGSYYSYTGTLPYESSSQPNNIIVFDSAKVTVNMSAANMDTLGTLISLPSNIPSINNEYNTDLLFYNTVGTTADDLLSDDIYIDCQLLDSDGNVVQKDDKVKEEEDESSDKEMEMVLLVGEVLLGLGIAYLGWRFYKFTRNKIDSASS